MSKYKCIYNLNRECIAIPHGLSCSEICYKAYQQGRADKEKELAELPNEYSDKLYKIAFNKGF